MNLKLGCKTSQYLLCWLVHVSHFSVPWLLPLIPVNWTIHCISLSYFSKLCNCELKIWDQMNWFFCFEIGAVSHHSNWYDSRRKKNYELHTEMKWLYHDIRTLKRFFFFLVNSCFLQVFCFLCVMFTWYTCSFNKGEVHFCVYLLHVAHPQQICLMRTTIKDLSGSIWMGRISQICHNPRG